ncbi:MAG TPA: solute carrier family 23 protein [Euzebyales bacterium]|nr:solute carrier family 23 protein [Euzebyales bacterium]
MTTAASQIELNYGLDDVPKPFPKALGLGLQHVLTMFGATIAVPLLLGPAMQMDTTDIAILISSVFIASGVATILQVTIGTRLPIVQGVSFAFLGPFFAIIAAHSGTNAMRYIGGAILLGAVVEAVVGFSGLVGLLRRFITPVVIGPVIALIGLSLFGAANLQVNTITDDQGNVVQSGNWWIAILTFSLIFLFALVLSRRSRALALFPILLAVVTAYVVALVLSELGVITEANRAFVSFGTISDSFASAAWVRNVVGERALFFPWGMPLFDLGFFVAVLAAYLASTIESFGDYHAVARVAGAGEPTPAQINRGIGAEGLGCAFTGLVGGFASTSYSENIGLVGLTKVASRYVVIVGAVALVLLGFVTKFGAIIATIPTPIVGGVYMALFGLIAAVGLSNLLRADMSSQRNLLIAGFVLFMGLVVPDYMASLPPDWSLGGQGWLTNLATSIFGSGIAVGALLGLLLDNLIPGTDAERGIAPATGLAFEPDETRRADGAPGDGPDATPPSA